MKNSKISSNLKLIFSKFANFKTSINKSYGKEFLDHLSLFDITTYNNSNSNSNSNDNELNLFLNNSILFLLKVKADNANLQGNMHGGAAATALDIASTISTSCVEKDLKHNVSVDMKLQFLAPVKVNKEVIIVCQPQIINETTAICKADIYDFDANKFLIKSQHLKCFIDKSWI